MSQKHSVIKLRRGTAAEWASSQPQPGGEVLRLGEPGFEKDTKKLKIGDGVTGWNDLPYINGGNSLDVEGIQDLLGESGFLIPGEGISLVYDDINNTLTIDTDFNTSLVAGTDIELSYNNTDNTLTISNTKQTFDAAVPWTSNHTLADGTRYLAGDLVYSNGRLYKANYDNESMPVSDTTYWTDLGPGYRLNIDGRDIPNIPNPFDQDLNTFNSPTFNTVAVTGSQIFGGGTNSGDGNGYGTIELVPDSGLYNNDQYLIIDPTGPNHVHLRAGGTIDNSMVELILGGEHANVRVIDNGHQVNIRAASGGLRTIYFSPHCSTPGSYTVSDGISNNNPLPQGTTFVYDNIQYSIETTSFDEECQNGSFFSISPEPPSSLFEQGSVDAMFPFSDKNWTFQNDGNLNIPGNILLNNGTSVAIGTFDNNTGGNSGISLNCAAGYELNWQGGHLKSTSNNGITSEAIHIDSNIILDQSSISIGNINPNDKLHIKDGNIRLQSSQHTEGNVTQKSAIIYTTQNEDVEIAKIEMERTAWAGAPSNINFYTRINENVNKVVSIRENGTIQLLLDGGGITFPDNTTQNTAYTGGLSDSNTYIICKTGDDLAAKYAAAKSLTPGGNPLSSTNRATLIIMPGNYTLSEKLVIDAEFVDILGLGSMKLNRGCKTAVTLLNNNIDVTANNVRVKGISVGNQTFGIANDRPLQIIEDCIGGTGSFGAATYPYGDSSYASIISGTFINCTNTGGYGFGNGCDTSGTFINCWSADASYGSSNTGDASGLFINCYGARGFGAYGTASGTFIDCEGTEHSFGGGGGTASGDFENCVGGDGSFGSGSGAIASGNFTNCVGGNYSFGHYGTASGIFRNCKGGEYGGFGSGVGAAPGIASGQFYNCIGGNNSFGSSSGGGIVSGFFENCTAKQYSFGYSSDTVSGTFLKCTLLTGTFPTLSGSGKIRLCIDGNYDIINDDADLS